MIIEPGTPFDLLGMEISSGRITISSHSMTKIKRKIRRFTQNAIRTKQKMHQSPDEAASALIQRINLFFFGGPGNGKLLSWARWAFPVITETSSLKEIDHYIQTSIRYVLYGSMKQRKQRIPYTKLNQLGYQSLVYCYHHQNKIPSIRAI